MFSEKETSNNEVFRHFTKKCQFWEIKFFLYIFIFSHVYKIKTELQ